VPATVRTRNGSGVNDQCLEAQARPVLGTSWPLRVYAGGSGIRTFVVGFDRGLDGLGTPRGELLVRTPALGGVKLFNDESVSKGKYASHSIPLPLDVTLQGLEVSFQALVLEDGNEHYCNALDATATPSGFCVRTSNVKATTFRHLPIPGSHWRRCGGSSPTWFCSMYCCPGPTAWRSAARSAEPGILPTPA
jgi:hypothetical protein